MNHTDTVHKYRFTVYCYYCIVHTLLNQATQNEDDGSYAKCIMYDGDDRDRTAMCNQCEYFVHPCISCSRADCRMPPTLCEYVKPKMPDIGIPIGRCYHQCCSPFRFLKIISQLKLQKLKFSPWTAAWIQVNSDRPCNRHKPQAIVV